MHKRDTMNGMALTLTFCTETSEPGNPAERKLGQTKSASTEEWFGVKLETLVPTEITLM